MEHYINRQLSDKRMKLCIVVVHDLSNDISYNAKLYRPKICYSKNSVLKIAKNWKIFIVSTFVDIMVYNFVQWKFISLIKI